MISAPCERTPAGAIECTLVQELKGWLSSNYKPAAKGLLKIMEMCAEHGPYGFPTAIVHCLCRKARVYEFIKGDLRLLFFTTSKGNLVIGSHTFLKKGQKTPESEIEQARRLKRDVEMAEKKGALKLVRD